MYVNDMSDGPRSYMIRVANDTKINNDILMYIAVRVLMKSLIRCKKKV